MKFAACKSQDGNASQLNFTIFGTIVLRLLFGALMKIMSIAFNKNTGFSTLSFDDPIYAVLLPIILRN